MSAGMIMESEVQQQARPQRKLRLWFALPVLSLLVVIGAGLPWAAAQFQQPERWSHRVVEQYPHDSDAFTQGLIVHNGLLIEGTGHFGKSRLQQIDLATGKVIKSVALPDQYFGEGIAIANGELFQLTWKNRVAFVYNPDTLEYLRTERYSGQGWGLTFDGQHLIMSDGSAVLRFYDPKTFRVVRRVTVHDGRRTIDKLNELEFIDGEVWANVWYSDELVRIDPTDGRVLGWVNLKGLKPPGLLLDREAVYNGIAWNSEDRRLFVTGKNWPVLYEIECVE